MKFVVPIILILLTIGLFFGYIDPTYDDLTELRAEVDEFDVALDRSREFIAVRDRLLSSYNSFSSGDLTKLRKLLPDHVDSVRLVIDIDNIAARHGMRLADISIQAASDENRGETPSSGGLETDAGLGTIDLSFSVTAPYTVVKKFLMDLEDSLRIVDVESLSFSASNDDTSSYTFTIKTYWLR